MEEFNYSYLAATSDSKQPALVGVVNSGNLEILLEITANPKQVTFAVSTRVKGFSSIWQAVIEDFNQAYSLGGLKFTLIDSGATPAVVALRLRQAYEASLALDCGLADPLTARYSELSARKRICGLVDAGSFYEIYPPEKRMQSPHLAAFDLLPALDDGVVIGEARLSGSLITIAAQQAEFIGGAIGEVNGAKICGICLRAIKLQASAVVLLLDSGGVRLQEANAGEIAIAEIIRSIFAVRQAGIPVIALVAGKNGAFGGVGIIAACVDHLFISELGRTGVSGPEVIETVMGIEEYDSADRPLVWRTCGGKARTLLGLAEFCSQDLRTIREQLIAVLDRPKALTHQHLLSENMRFRRLLQQFSDVSDGFEIWQALGIVKPEEVPGMNDGEFKQLLAELVERKGVRL